MNFVSHYFLDQARSSSSHFFFGVITPDLVGVFDRRIKLKPHSLPPIEADHVSMGELSFYKGVLRHFEVDAVFHTSVFFNRETKLLQEELREYFDEETLPRSYFIAHILLELLLDKVLIEAHPEVLPTFYQHLLNIPSLQQLELTEWVCRAKMHRYQAYLMRFQERQYLYDYRDWRHILSIMRRILDNLRIKTGDALHHPNMLRVLRAYEQKLQGYWPELFVEMDEKLRTL